jgi:CRISPR-associated protein Csm4
MAKTVCYCLMPRSPFHFGERGVGMEEASVVLHADTLFSALCLTLLELNEDLSQFLDRFPRQRFDQGRPGVMASGIPPFRLASAFPFWASAKGEHVFFFPKPFLPLLRPSAAADLRQAKALKRIQFVSQPLFEAWLAGEKLEFDAGHLIQGGKIWLTPAERQRIDADTLWVEETRPHVTVDRRSGASQVFAVGQVRFAPRAGLFFLVAYRDEGWQPRLEKALRALGDSGIGGERSTGRGQFRLEIVEPFALKAPSEANAFTTLSLYWPPEQEVQAGILEGAAYGLSMRRGWIASPQGMNLRRRGVRMLSEGSVFPRPPQGALVDVKPLDPEEVPNVPHDVWRYGLAFPWPCRRHMEGNHG